MASHFCQGATSLEQPTPVLVCQNARYLHEGTGTLQPTNASGKSLINQSTDLFLCPKPHSVPACGPQPSSISDWLYAAAFISATPYTHHPRHALSSLVTTHCNGLQPFIFQGLTTLVSTGTTQAWKFSSTAHSREPSGSLLWSYKGAIRWV